MEKNVRKILFAMIDDGGEKTDKYYTGNQIKEFTGLSPIEINDAVSLMYSQNLVEWIQGLGTAPYEFSSVRPNYLGRNAYDMIKSEEKEDHEVDGINQNLVFISYSSEDSLLAGRVKKVLEENGLEAFLAHQDIEKSEKWSPMVESKLEECGCLLAIITDNFGNRWWTNQEVGFAMGATKRIFPIFLTKPDRNSMGFLPDFQGANRVNEDNLEKKALEIAQTILVMRNEGKLLLFEEE